MLLVFSYYINNIKFFNNSKSKDNAESLKLCHFHPLSLNKQYIILVLFMYHFFMYHFLYVIFYVSFFIIIIFFVYLFICFVFVLFDIIYNSLCYLDQYSEHRSHLKLLKQGQLNCIFLSLLVCCSFCRSW